MENQPGGGRATMSLPVSELLVWVASLAAFAGLVQEYLRRESLDPTAIFPGVFLLIYVVYLSFSVAMFWRARRIVIPTTLLVSCVLWTLSLQFAAQASLGWSIAAIAAVPLLTAFVLSKVFPKTAEPTSVIEPDDGSTTVRTLLAKDKRFGQAPRR